MSKSESNICVRPDKRGNIVKIVGRGERHIDLDTSFVSREIEQSKNKNRMERYALLFDSGFSKAIFDHLRNYLMCSFLLAVGITEFRQYADTSTTFAASNYAAMAIITLSCILFCLNLFDGIVQISKYKYHSIYTLGLVVCYAVMSIGVIELAVNFRAAI